LAQTKYFAEEFAEFHLEAVTILPLLVNSFTSIGL